MVGIFTGAGTGAERGSSNILGGSGLLGSAALGRSGGQVMLNAANGNLMIQGQDEMLIGRGPDAAIVRTYNSLGDLSDDNGDNWRQSTQRQIRDLIGTVNTAGSSVKRVSGDGSVITYGWTGSAYVATDGAGAFDRLTFDGTWRWTDGDSGQVEAYGGPDNQISQLTDRSGNSLTYTYAGGQLSDITTANGERIHYVWSGANLTEVQTVYNDGGTWKQQTRTRYAYDGYGRLSNVTVDLAPNDNSVADGVSYTTSYTYHGTSKMIASIAETDGTRIDIQYDVRGRVVSLAQTVSSDVTRTTLLDYGPNHTKVTDAAGQVTRLDYAATDFADPIERWHVGGQYRETATVDGRSAVRVTVLPDQTWTGVYQVFDVAAGDVVSGAMTIQAAGTQTSQVFGLYSAQDGWSAGMGGARIVSGPGSLVRYDGDSLWRIDGLSESEATRVEIMRQYNAATNGGFYVYNDLTGGLRAGSQLLLADPSLTKTGNFAAPVGTWYLEGQSRAAATIAGRPAARLTALPNQGWIGTAQIIFANAGETIDFGVTLQAIGSVTEQSLGLYSDKVGWGAADAASAWIASGPGSITQEVGGLWAVSGLSVTEPTRIVIRRRYDQASSGGAYIYNDLRGGLRGGSEMLVADPTLSRNPEGRAGQLLRITAPPPINGAPPHIVEFGYDTSGNVTSMTNAAGTTGYTYDDRGNVTRVDDPLGNSTWRNYNAANQVAVEMRGGADDTFDYAYHSTRYIYDALGRQRFIVDAEGGVIEFNYGVDGRINWSRRYVSARYDVSALPWNAELTEGVVAAWAATADHTGSEHIEYVYDERLNLNHQINYGRMDAAGNLSVADGFTDDFFTYDQSGQLLNRRTVSLTMETFVYDGLGRLTASTDSAGATTNIVFNDAATQTVVTLASGLVRTSTFNRAGELISSSESGSYVAGGTVANAYDVLGRLRRTTDALGNNSYFVYDKLGRKVADVDVAGAVTEYRYDSADRLVATVRYAHVMSTAQGVPVADPNAAPDIAAIRPAPHAMDIWAFQLFDAAGRLIQTTAGDGSVTRFEYDRSDRLIRTTQFDNKLTQAQLDAFKVNGPSDVQPTASAADSITRTFYDRVGRIVGTLDGEGYVTRLSYDKAGRKVAETSFYNATAVSLRAAGSFSNLVASVGTHAQDATTRYVYDAQGNLRFEVDGLNRVVEHGYQYDTPTWSWGWSAHGPERATTSYAGTIAVLANYTIDSVRQALANAGLTGNASNRVSYAVYDDYHAGAGRLMYSISAVGAVVGYKYDSAGRIIRKVEYANLCLTPYLPSQSDMDAWAGGVAGNGDNRVTRYFYNARDELRFTIDPEGYVTRNDYDADGQRVFVAQWTNAVVANDGWTIDTVAANQSGDWAGTSYRYDHSGRLKGSTDGAGNTRDLQYYGTGELAWEIASSGGADEVRTLYSYDSAGRRTLEIRAWGTAEQATTQFSYDGRGNVVAVTDPNDRTTTRSYDRANQLISETNAAGGTASYQYDALGNQVAVTDVRGNTTYNYYDKLGRLVVTRDAESYATEFGYTVFGELAYTKRSAAQVTSAANAATWPSYPTSAGDATTSFEYDRLGRVMRTIDAEGYAESREYNAFGGVSRITNKIGGITDFTYYRRGQLYFDTVFAPIHDSGGNLVASTYHKNLYQYDSRGNVSAHFEGYDTPAQRLTTFAYDKADRLVTKTQHSVPVLNVSDLWSVTTVNTVESYAYDTRGNLIQVTDPNGARTQYYYDDQNRRVAEVSATGTLSQFRYDAAGNLTHSRTWGTTIALPGTPGGTPPAAPGGGYRETVNAYDAINRLVSTSIENVRTGAWNGSAFVLSMAPITTSYAYDAMGNVLRVTDANGVSVHNYYDRLGRRTRSVDGEGFVTGWIYDAEGNVWHERRWSNRTNYAVLGAWNDPASSADDRITEFSYDRNGRRITEQRYDVAAHGVDGAGNLYQLSPTSHISYAYNGLGEVTLKTEATGETTSYQYDSSGRLTQESRQGFFDAGGNSVTPILIYRYDALGNLVYAYQGATQGGAARVTRNGYDAAGRLAWSEDANGATTYNFYDAAGNLLRQSYERSGATHGAYIEGALFTRDAAGRVVSQTIGQWNGTWVKGDRQDTEYNAYGNAVRRGTNGGWQETLSYDGAGRLVRTNSGDGVQRFFVSDRAGNRTLALESEGTSLNGLSLEQALGQASNDFAVSLGSQYVDGINVTIGVFDRRGQQTATYLPKRQLDESGGVTDLWTARSYTAFGEVASETDARGFTTSYLYNTMGRAIQVTRPQVNVSGENGVVTAVNPTEYSYYDLSGRTIAARDANGNLTTRQLLAGTGYGGSEALVTREWHADGGVAVRGYDRFGDLRTSTDEVGRVTAMTYDAISRLTQVVRPSGQADSYGYDILGQRTWHSTTEYGAGVRETTSYDQQGRITSQTNLAGEATTTSYDWNAGIAANGLGAAAGGWSQVTTYLNGRTAIEQSDVWGHVTSTTDLGGNSTAYDYDHAGRLVSRSGSESVSYGWLNAGLLGSQSRGGEVTAYSYNAAGQKTRELFTSYGAVISDGNASYDALGRMTTWSQGGQQPGASLTHEYDANGNVRRTYASFAGIDYQGNAYAAAPQDHWFRYDAMNRMVTQKGQLVGGQIVRGAGGVDYSYDAAGQRMSATRTASRSMEIHNPNYYPDPGYNPGGWQSPTEWGGGDPTMPYYYEAEVRDQYSYTADGQLATVRVAESGASDNYDGTATVTAPPAVGALKGQYSYDGLGRMTHQVDWLGDGYGAAYDRTVSYNAAGQATYETVVQRQGADTITSYITTDYGYGASSALGQAVSSSTTSYRNGSYQGVGSVTNSYAWYNNAQLLYAAHSDQQGQYGTSYFYAPGGVLQSVSVGGGRPRTITFANDMNGQVLRRDEADYLAGGDPHEHWYRFDGKQLGYTGNNGTSDTDYGSSIAARTQAPGTGAFRNGQGYGGAVAEFDGQVTGITSFDQGAGGGAYTVRSGDTLAGIATGLWGDASLWYKLAAANGLSGDASLIAGQTLNVPAGVIRSGSTASTFKPYDPAEALGDTSPTSPQPKARPKKNKCGMFGQILLIAVAIAVTAIIANPLIGVAAVAETGAAATGLTAVLGAGGAAIAGGAIAAAAGSIVSQGIGLITGIQDKFSFKGVALAALGGAVGGGLGAYNVGGSGVVGAAVRGALGSATTQGIAVATGLQSKFDWAGVAVGGVVGGLGRAIGGANPGFGRELGASAASGLAGAAARSLITGTSFGDNLLAVLPDVVGTTIGRIAARQIAGGSPRTSSNRLAPSAPPTEGGMSALQMFALGAVAVDPSQMPLNLRDGYSLAEGVPADAAANDRMWKSMQALAAKNGDNNYPMDQIKARYEGWKAYFARTAVTVAVPAPPIETNYSPTAELIGIAKLEARAAVTLTKQALGGIYDLAAGTFNTMKVLSSGWNPIASAKYGEQIHIAVRSAGNMRARDVPGVLISPAVHVVDQAFVHDNLRPTFSFVAGSALGAVTGMPRTGGVGAAKGVGSRGLRGTSVVSAQRAETFLVKNGFTSARAREFVGSFDGPITARIVRPGEDFSRYTDYVDGSGSFLTKTRFRSPAEAVDGLYLAPYGNGAALVQAVTSTGRSIVLEGAIRNGGRGIRQTVIHNRGAFDFGPGVGY